MSPVIGFSHLARLVYLLFADTSFVLASRPPHQADSNEIHRDEQALVDHSIPRIPLVVGPLIYGLTLAQFCHEYASGKPHPRSTGWEALGALGMILGGQLRLWCYRVLGRFFTFNVSLP